MKVSVLKKALDLLDPDDDVQLENYEDIGDVAVVRRKKGKRLLVREFFCVLNGDLYFVKGPPSQWSSGLPMGPVK